MIRDALVAEEATTVVRDENVVLDADTAEILVGFEHVEVQEFLAMPAGLPVIDEGGDKVDAWFVGHHESFFQSSTHAQTVRSKLLKVRTRLFVEAHIDLSESLHVMM